MKKFEIVALMAAIAPSILLSADGQTLINQSTVKAFPYTITQSGSYKLTGNLVVPASVDGIHIYVDKVTLDLNGFSITGPFACSGTVISCPSQPNTVGIAIQADEVGVQNGTVQGFGTGITANGSGHVTDLESDGNVSGMFVSGFVAERVSANKNLLIGINALGSTLLHAIAASNNTGIRCFASTASDALVHANVYGFDVAGCTLLNSLAIENQTGVLVTGNSLANDSTFRANISLDVVQSVNKRLFSPNSNLCSSGAC